MLLAGPRRDARRRLRRTTRKQLLQFYRDRSQIFQVLVLAAFRRPLALPGAAFLVGQTLLLRTAQGFGGDEDSLAFVAVAGARPLDDHGAERRMLCGPAREGGVAAGQILQMRKVGTGQTERLVVLHTNPAPLAQFLAALGAFRVAADDEHDDVF